MPKVNNITISLTNSKLGGKIPSVNLPPIKTCRPGAPCARLCYARKGHWRYSNVEASRENNYQEYLKNPMGYFNSIKEFLTSGLVTYKFFRWHSSGDIPEGTYFELMCKLAREVPEVKFLAFTKRFEIINREVDAGIKIPENLKIVFSAWDKDFEVPNPHNFPVTYVNFCDKSKNPEIPEFSIPCIGSCEKCQACWSLHKGQSVVFHQH